MAVDRDYLARASQKQFGREGHPELVAETLRGFRPVFSVWMEEMEAA